MWGAFERFALGCETDRRATVSERESSIGIDTNPYQENLARVSHTHKFSLLDLTPPKLTVS